MKIRIPSTKEIDVTHLYMVLPVNYGEEEMPNDFPFRIGNTWAATVEVDTGKIRDWPAGKTADVFLTVKDSGSYHLLNAKGENVARIEYNYVPHRMVPGSYGDTVELKIDGEGKIANWPSNPDAADFFKDED